MDLWTAGSWTDFEDKKFQDLSETVAQQYVQYRPNKYNVRPTNKTLFRWWLSNVVSIARASAPSQLTCSVFYNSLDGDGDGVFSVPNENLKPDL